MQPLLILWPHQSFAAMGTSGDKCRLLLIEDPALEAQPGHEVAVGAVPAPPPPPPAFKGPKCLGGVRLKDCTWAPSMGPREGQHGRM